jgi:hypothetical protein
MFWFIFIKNHPLKSGLVLEFWTFYCVTVSSCAVVISLVTTYAFIGSLFRACEELCIVSEICDCGVFETEH